MSCFTRISGSIVVSLLLCGVITSASLDTFEEVKGSVGTWSDEESFREGGRYGWKDKWTYSVSAEGLNGFELTTVNGDVELIGSDTETIHIVASRTVRATDREKGLAYREQFHPVVRRSAATLVVKTHRPEKHKSRPRYIKEAGIAYKVSLPARFVVQAKTVNGSVKVKQIQDKASLHTVNGNIELTTSESLGGGVEAKTVNGKIRIRTSRLMASSHMATVNGNVEVTVTDVFAGGLRAKTVNGSVHLRVPPDASFELRAHVGLSGSIQTDWGKPIKSSGFLGSSFKGDINEGGDRVALETLNGSIRVEQHIKPVASD